MAKWIDVAPVEDFLPGTYRTVDVDNVPIAVFNVNGNYYAIEDVCTHEAETLSDGEVEGEEIVCPRHGSHFSLATGEALSPPAYEPVATFPVRVEDGMVQVKDDRWDQFYRLCRDKNGTARQLCYDKDCLYNQRIELIGNGPLDSSVFHLPFDRNVMLRAGLLKAQHPEWDCETCYEQARRQLAPPI